MDLRRSDYFLAKNELGEPVSMTAVTRETPHSANLSYVYTPPEYRGRGCASAIVATVSRRVLDAGKRFCTLYTDLANPTSNKTYRSLGYRPVADFCEVTFADRSCD